jgi:DNA helicase-2/ATP-dependent DNA helicase PcrA
MGINYRCPAPVMEHAVQCIERNSNRITKALVAQKQDEGAVECWEYRDPYEEAWEVVDRIEEVHRDGVPYREIFILYRTHAQSMPFEEELTRREIPYWIKKAGAFYKRKEIRGLLAYLRLLVDPHNAEAGRQALTNPFRYVKRSTLDAIDREVTGGGATYLDAAERVGHVQWNIRITDFVALMRSLRAEDNAGETLDVIVQETDYINKIMEREGSGGWEDSLEVAIDELARSAWRFRTAGAFLQFVEDQIAQASKRSKKKDAVQCMSIHGAKGLEATLVCLVGANKGLLPISKATSAAALEEERRLFYVAITRSKRLLHVSCYVGSEEDRGGASQFIEEAGFEVRPGPKRDE